MNPSPRIKICGLTRLEDALLSYELGATYLGIIMAKGTPREVSEQDARIIIHEVRRIASKNPPKLVGVFLHESPEEIADLQTRLDFDHVQVHGEVTEKHRSVIPVPVVPAFRMKTAESASEAIEALRFGPVLLDAYAPDKHGGTGHRFNHDWAIPVVEKGPVYIAGGLGPENIAEVVHGFRTQGILPHAFDLSSGVEEVVRIKSPDKLRAFFEQFKRALRA